jgi:hypothetical protein
MKIPNGSSCTVIFAPTLQRESKDGWRENGTNIKVLLLEKWSTKSLFFEILIAPCASLVIKDLSKQSNVLE